MLAPDAQCFYCLLIICSPFTSWQSRNLIPNAAVNIWIFRCRFILSARSFFGTAATVLLKVIRDRIWRTPQYSIRGHTIYVLQRESNIPLVFISSNAEYILSSVVGNITKRNCSACVDFFYSSTVRKSTYKCQEYLAIEEKSSYTSKWTWSPEIHLLYGV